MFYWFKGEALAISEIAAKMGVSYATAWNYCNSGRAIAVGNTERAPKKQRDYDKADAPKYDAFIAEMKAWGKPE